MGIASTPMTTSGRTSVAQQPPTRSIKPPWREPSVYYNTAHRIGVYRIRLWDRDSTTPVGHYDVLTLPNDPKASVLECANSLLMWDSGIWGTA
jgi:hypothetical protein